MTFPAVTLSKARVTIDGTPVPGADRQRFLIRRTGEVYTLDNRGRRTFEGQAVSVQTVGKNRTVTLDDGRTVLAIHDCGCGGR